MADPIHHEDAAEGGTEGGVAPVQPPALSLSPRSIQRDQTPGSTIQSDTLLNLVAARSVR